MVFVRLWPIIGKLPQSVCVHEVREFRQSRGRTFYCSAIGRESRSKCRWRLVAAFRSRVAGTECELPPTRRSRTRNSFDSKLKSPSSQEA